MRITASAILTAVVLGVVAPGALATEPFAKVGTYTSTMPDYSRAVRNEGMGATGVADPSRAANTTYNPANVVGEDGFFTFYQHDDFLNRVTVHDAGLSFSRTTSDGGFQYAFGVRHLHQNHEVVVERTVFLPQGTGGIYDPDDYYTAFTLGAGINRGNVRVAVGTAAKVLRLEFANDHASGWVFDFGARADWMLEGESGDVAILRVGASAIGFEYDLGNRDYDMAVADQTRLGVGVGYTAAPTIADPFSDGAVPVASMAVNADYVHRDRWSDDDDGLAVGVELGLAEILYVRAGGVSAVPAHSDGATWGVGIAAGLAHFRVRVDAAWYDLDNWLFESDDDLIWGVAIDYLP